MLKYTLKLALILSSLLISSMSLAQKSIHYCTADGYSASGALVSVSGEEKETIEEAEESAIKMCRNYGLSVCQISSCFSYEGIDEAVLSSAR